jgi:homeobox protein cut-like
MSYIDDLNTEDITNRIKETLLNNNIGQKLFGEAVLNLSQGTVSELLSKPKPWNTLSIKGREPYLRMYMWLNDASRLGKLSDWKEEKNSRPPGSLIYVKISARFDVILSLLL